MKSHLKTLLLGAFALLFCNVLLQAQNGPDGIIHSGFQYSSTPNCQFGPNILPLTVNDPGTLFFQEVTGNIIFVDSVTGEIDMTASQPGTWTVKRVHPSDSTMQQITIIAIDDASFSYLVDTLCDGLVDTISPVVTGVGGGVFHSNFASLVMDSTNGLIDVFASPSGTYIVSYTTENQCPNTGYDTLVIGSFASAYFNYVQFSFCNNGTTLPDTLTSNGLGLFSAVPSGLTLNPTTGVIDLSSSTGGIYQVTYTIGGVCGDVHTEQLTVVEAFIGDLFDYLDTTFCRGDAPRTPVVLGPSGLFFSGSSGVNINSSTGEIDPSAMAVGSYTVTAASNTACGETSTQGILVLDTVQVVITSAGNLLSAPGPGSNFQWYLNGNLISGATDSTYLATASGNYSVSYHRQGDECGTEGTLLFTGMESTNTWLASSHIYPNPSNGLVNYDIALQRASKLDWELRDGLGSLIRMGQMGASARYFQGKLDFSDLPAGTYLLRVGGKEGMKAEKIVLMR